MGYRNDYLNSSGLYEKNNGWYTCQKCGKHFREGDMDIDHIIPQKFGGSDKLVNLQCICKHCNRSKQASMKDTPKDLARSIARETRRRKTEARMERRLRSGVDDRDDEIIRDVMRRK